MVENLRKIGMASDHAGYELKEYIKEFLTAQGYEIKDFGTNGLESVDYPDFVHPLAKEIENQSLFRGIVICGSGIGVSITANKHKNVRAALCWMPEIAKLCRNHNNANMLAMPARFISTAQAEAITEMFLNSEFEGGRHQNRIDKIEI